MLLAGPNSLSMTPVAKEAGSQGEVQETASVIQPHPWPKGEKPHDYFKRCRKYLVRLSIYFLHLRPLQTELEGLGDHVEKPGLHSWLRPDTKIQG